MNIGCNNHSRVQPCTADKYILLLNNFSYLNGVALYACRKPDGHIDGLLRIFGHNVSLVCYKGPLGIDSLQQASDCVCSDKANTYASSPPPWARW